MEAGKRNVAVIEMTKDNDHSTLMPCFPKSDTEPTRHLALVTSGLASDVRPTFLVPTICLH
jgi:hypothetical protein